MFIVKTLIFKIQLLKDLVLERPPKRHERPNGFKNSVEYLQIYTSHTPAYQPLSEQVRSLEWRHRMKSKCETVISSCASAWGNTRSWLPSFIHWMFIAQWLKQHSFSLAGFWLFARRSRKLPRAWHCLITTFVLWALNLYPWDARDGDVLDGCRVMTSRSEKTKTRC